MEQFQVGLSKKIKKILEENKVSLPEVTLKKFSGENIVRLTERTRKFLEENKVKYKKLNENMIKANYPPVDNLSIFGFFHEFEKPINDSIDIKNIDKIVSAYFDETHLDWLSEDIETYDLKTEVKVILIEAIKGYKQGYYNLVIPTLFSRLEGMLYNSVSYDEHGNYKNLQTIIMDAIDKYNGEFFDVLSKKDIENLKNNYTNKMLDHFVFGNDKTEFSRHSIMHGSSVDYGTKINCIKLFLHFEYLYHCVQELKKLENYNWK